MPADGDHGRSRSRELPDCLPLVTQLEYIKDILAEWDRAATKLCEEVYMILLTRSRELVQQQFAPFGQEVLKHQIQHVFRRFALPMQN